jgi:hypothetical protein
MKTILLLVLGLITPKGFAGGGAWVNPCETVSQNLVNCEGTSNSGKRVVASIYKTTVLNNKCNSPQGIQKIHLQAYFAQEPIICSSSFFDAYSDKVVANSNNELTVDETQLGRNNCDHVIRASTLNNRKQLKIYYSAKRTKNLVKQSRFAVLNCK